MAFFTKTKSTVAEILATFTKAIDELDSLSFDRDAAADTALADADKLRVQADWDRKEAELARTAASNLRNLIPSVQTEDRAAA